MTYIVADTNAQAAFWAKQFGIEAKNYRFVTSVDKLIGVDRDAKIIAVGPLKLTTTHDIISTIEERGFTIQFPPHTG